MEESSDDHTRQLEECIMKVIQKIKADRSRPCYQSILTFVNRKRKKHRNGGIKIYNKRHDGEKYFI